MFVKKQLIYSETLGVCRVENIVQLSAVKDGPQREYYVLKPLLDSRQAAYLPVKDHAQVLRELFTEEEARQLKDTRDYRENENLKKAVDYVLKENDKENV